MLICWEELGGDRVYRPFSSVAAFAHGALAQRLPREPLGDARLVVRVAARQQQNAVAARAHGVQADAARVVPRRTQRRHVSAHLPQPHQRRAPLRLLRSGHAPRAHHEPVRSRA